MALGSLIIVTIAMIWLNVVSSFKLFKGLPSNKVAPLFDNIELDSVPRLHENIDEYLEWIESNGGTFLAKIVQQKDGWSLSTTQKIPQSTEIIKIPKNLCIYADPAEMMKPLLSNTEELMNALDISQWRARLAIALISERVKPNSFFKPYIQNLPFEFWGVPVFFSPDEFK